MARNTLYVFPENEIGQLITIAEWGTPRWILNITSVPYHLFQIVAMAKCPAPDSRYGIGYGDLCQSGATGKCLVPDFCHGITYDNGFQ